VCRQVLLEENDHSNPVSKLNVLNLSFWATLDFINDFKQFIEPLFKQRVQLLQDSIFHVLVIHTMVYWTKPGF
jgi:hypothetical protein